MQPQQKPQLGLSSVKPLTASSLKGDSSWIRLESLKCSNWEKGPHRAAIPSPWGGTRWLVLVSGVGLESTGEVAHSVHVLLQEVRKHCRKESHRQEILRKWVGESKSLSPPPGLHPYSGKEATEQKWGSWSPKWSITRQKKEGWVWGWETITYDFNNWHNTWTAFHFFGPPVFGFILSGGSTVIPGPSPQIQAECRKLAHKRCFCSRDYSVSSSLKIRTRMLSHREKRPLLLDLC